MFSMLMNESFVLVYCAWCSYPLPFAALSSALRRGRQSMICSRSLNGFVSAMAWSSASSCGERILDTPTFGCDERQMDATPNGSFQHSTGTRRPERN